ncbi:MAG: hypothetical protein JWN57_824 [Frankiales bacterium]|jgi:hypothetical protein|nr:hypothetical protein [Frankiales bacterium]
MLPRPAPRARAAVALAGLSALIALAVATPAGAFGTQAVGPTPAATPAPVPTGAVAPGVITGATPASPIPAQPDFAG